MRRLSSSRYVCWTLAFAVRSDGDGKTRGRPDMPLARFTQTPTMSHNYEVTDTNGSVIVLCQSAMMSSKQSTCPV